jgi:hypothetical protein
VEGGPVAIRTYAFDNIFIFDWEEFKNRFGRKKQPTQSSSE